MKILLLLLSLLLVSCEPEQQQIRVGEEGGLSLVSSSDKVGVQDEGLSDKEIKAKAKFCRSFKSNKYMSRCIDELRFPVPDEAKLQFCQSFDREDLRMDCAMIVRGGDHHQNNLANCRVIKDEPERLACIGGLHEEEERVVIEEQEEIEEDNEVVIVEEEETVIEEVISPAPIDGYFSEWARWSKCSKSCGGGTMRRHRSCAPPKHGGKDCSGSSVESKACNTHACLEKPEPVDGRFTNWSAWGICSKSCNGGKQKRYRKCIKPQHGGKACYGRTIEYRSCNVFRCPVVVDTPGDDGPITVEPPAVETPKELIPVDGYYSEWSEWSKCSKTCGTGTVTRTRVCIPPQNGGKQCIGNSIQTNYCSLKACVSSSPTVDGPSSDIKQCTSVDRKALSVKFVTKDTGRVILSNSDYNMIKSVSKRNCSYMIAADMGFLKIFVSSGTFRINQIFGDANSGVSAGEFKVQSINQTATQLGLIYFEKDFYPNPYAKKNYSARLANGAIFYKLLSPGSSRVERVISSSGVQFEVSLRCNPRECEDEVVSDDPVVTEPIANKCNDGQDHNKYLKMSDNQLFDAGLNRQIGKCRISDARASSRAYCDYYVKTGVEGKLGMFGWPKNPSSGDSTGCIKAPLLPKRMSTCWPGNTASMCTNDHIHNAAETIRDAIKNCACF